MSQLGQPFEPSGLDGQKTSALAISSLVCSLIFCCPITTIIGPLLGVASMIVIPRNPALKGRALALTAIVLGVLFTGGQYLIGSWFVTAIIKPMLVGPNDALEAGFAGDIAGFKDGFYGPGATATDAEAQAFLDELEKRYGGFVMGIYNQQGQPEKQGPIMPFRYLLKFDSAQVDASVEIVFADDKTGEWPGKVGYITVYDSELGDLTYPASSAEGVPPASPTGTPEPQDVPDEPGGG